MTMGWDIGVDTINLTFYVQNFRLLHTAILTSHRITIGQTAQSMNRCRFQYLQLGNRYAKQW